MRAFFISCYLMLLLLACNNNQQTENYTRWQTLLQEILQKNQITQHKAVWQLKRQVEWEGNTKEGRERVARAYIVNQATDSLIAQIEQLKTEIKTQPPNRLSELLLGTQKNGKIYTLAQNTTKYCNWLLKNNSDIGVDTTLMPNIARDNFNKELYKNTNFKKLDFANTYFKNISSVQALAQLTKLEIEVYKYNMEVLKKLGAGEYGGHGWYMSRIEPKVFAQSDTIRAGDDFEAALVLAFSSQYQNYQWVLSPASTPKSMTFDKILQFVPQKVGKQTWEAQLKYVHPQTYADCTIYISQPYFVLPQ
jgi:hypothetical protein